MACMQVLEDKCFVKGADMRVHGEKRKNIHGGDLLAFSRERLPQTHALSQRANYTHAL